MLTYQIEWRLAQHWGIEYVQAESKTKAMEKVRASFGPARGFVQITPISEGYKA